MAESITVNFKLLNGKTQTLPNVDKTTTVSALKSKIEQGEGGLPLSQVRLVYAERQLGNEGASLAESNVEGPEATITLVGLYDAVIKVERFTDVYKKEKGWKVTMPAGSAKLAKFANTVKVAPIGHFNAGKTFVLSKLCGRNLPHGYRTHTEGLSIAVTEFAVGDSENWLAWMDTAGLNSPVADLGPMEGQESVEMANSDELANNTAKAADHGRKLMDLLRSNLSEAHRIEDFHRTVAYEFADVYLFVINQMSHNDQMEILLLLQMIERTKARKSVFVVHNLQTWSYEDLQKTQSDGYSYVSRVETLFFMQQSKVTVKASVDDDWNLAIPRAGGHASALRTEEKEIPFLAGVFGANANNRVSMLHVFLVNDRLGNVEKAHNACSLTHLRHAVTQQLPPRLSVMSTLADIMTKTQHKFAMTPAHEAPKLNFVKVTDGDDVNWRVHHVDASGHAADNDAAAVAMVLPSYLALGSDDLQYNVVKLEGQVAQIGRPGVMVDKTMYGVQVVLPGLTPEEVKEIQSKLKWNTAALRIEPGAEAKPTLVIDFSTREHLGPPHLLDKLVAAFPDGLVTACDTTPTIVDEGNRSIFMPGSNDRGATVQLRSGFSKVSVMVRPLVSYSDGVLSIVVTSNEPVAKKAGA